MPRTFLVILLTALATWRTAGALQAQPPVEPKQAATDLYGDPLPPGAVARLGTVRLRHESTGTLLATAFAGNVIATGGPAGLRFWDAATGKLLTHVAGNPEELVEEGAFTGRSARAVLAR